MILISVHDVKANTWSPPVCVQNKAAAIRDFGMACSRSDTVMGQCPADFDLWQYGEWFVPPSDDTDSIPRLDAVVRVHLANGADYVKQVQP